jgi:capsular polysaccharide transport system permease protein
VIGSALNRLSSAFGAREAASDVSHETGKPGRVIRPRRFNSDENELDNNQYSGPKNAKQKLSKIQFTWYSAILLIGLPTIFAILYFGFIASHQYASEVKFAVRSNERSMGTDQLGLLSQLSSTPLNNDSYIVVEYLKSRQFIEDAKKKINFEIIYAVNKADWLSRLSKNASIEDLVKYWNNRTSIHYDALTGIITVEVRAFTPKDSQIIAKVIEDLSSRLVNQLSANARAERVSAAEADVKRMEIRLASAMAMVQKLRDRTGVIDPAKSATAGVMILGKFQEELARLKTQLAILTRSMNPESLPVVNLKERIKAMQEQIDATRAQVGAPGTVEIPELSSRLLSEFEGLELEKQFSEKAYVAAMKGLELARSDANRNQRYLSVFVHPHIPEYPLYPKRIMWIFSVMVFSMLGWSIAWLLVLTVKDHII